MSSKEQLSRRGFLKATAMSAVSVLAASCAEPTPQVIEKEVPVEKVVKETVLVEKEVAIEKVVTPTPVVAKYKEAPMLAGKVASGELPPVDERLPDEPLVIEPHEEIGQYAGTWHRLVLGKGYIMLHGKVTYEWIVRYDPTATEIIPNVAKSWEISPDGREYTFSLRKGMKWSDGEPFTADDYVWKGEDVWENPDLPDAWAAYKSGGNPPVISKLDDTTVRFSFEVPHGLFMRVIASINGHALHGTLVCKHYFAQFHEKYQDKAVLDKMVKDAGYEHWYQLLTSKDDFNANPDMPVLNAWKIEVPPPKQPAVAIRNPYYWKVDPEGNQLPYIDRYEAMSVESPEIITLRAAQGEVDHQFQNILISEFPILKENEEKGDYRVLLNDSGKFNMVIGLNQTNQDPVLREIAQDKRFRFALSHGMNRPELIEAAFLGMTEPSQVSPVPGTPLYWEPQAKDKIEHDPDRANAYLDEMGLTERDSEGYRLRPDGKRLTLVYEYTPIEGAMGTVAELLAQHWKELGIHVIPKENGYDLHNQRFGANEMDISVWTGSGEFDPLIQPRSFIPHVAQANWGRQYAVWWDSDGAEGEEPTGAPREMLEIWDEIKMTVDEEEQRNLFRRILELNKENLFMLGICTPTPFLGIAKSNLRNVPEGSEALIDDQVRGPGNTRTEQFFFKQ